MRQVSKLALVAAISIVLLVCAACSTREDAVSGKELNISAAVSLKEAFNEIGDQFKQAHPSVTLVYNFGSSGMLEQQIQQGAPTDVFASAARDKMDALMTRGLVESKNIKIFARNSLVVVSPSAHEKIHLFSDLLKCDRVALGDPSSVPAGKYALEALSKAGIYSQLKKEQKIVFAENVRQVLAYVESNNVDAGIVYSTDAAISHSVRISFTVPPEFTGAIEYPIGIVASSPQKQLAQEYVDFVCGPHGQAILQQRGFIR